MAKRYVSADVVTRFGLFCDEAKRSGIDASGWLLEQPDGIYWRVMRREGEYGRTTLGFLPNGGNIGRTAEACVTLENIQAGMYAARTLRQG